AVNVLDVSQQELAQKFAKSSGEKFAGVEWKPGLGNAPVIGGSVAQFQCRAVNRYYGGDHIIFLGAVEAYSYNGQEPLLFSRGGFGKFSPGDGKNRGAISSRSPRGTSRRSRWPSSAPRRHGRSHSRAALPDT